ncbi:MAG: DUF4190 domain-containing protein [Pyrinomonadaceae bacterium]
MKQCPRCKQTYSDDQLNFCLEDGEMLSGFVQEQPSRYIDDSPPTVVLDEARRTNPTNWPAQPPLAPPAQWQQPAAAPAQFAQFAIAPSPNQTLAIVSLALGIASITIGWCCYSGLLLSPAALITGLIALSQIKRDPSKYTGKGLAIGGIATGGFFIAAVILLVLIYGAAMFFSAVS